MSRFICGFLILMLSACAPAEGVDAGAGDAGEELALASADLSLPQALHGLVLYTGAKFNGNGRTCETCHTLPTLALTPDHIEQQFQLNPSGPLFRALDSDNYDGVSYNLMRGDGLVRVHVVLAPNVTVDEVDGVNVQIRPDGRYVVVFRRATPTSWNTALNEHLMLDGREGADLAHQAISAVADHAQNGRPVLQHEADALEAFQQTLFTSPQLASYANGGPAPVLPAGNTASEIRGRAFFVSGPLSEAAGTHGLCATCHSGPMLNTVNQFNPGDPPGLRFTGNRTSEFNERGLPVYTFRITAMHDLLNDNPNLGPPGVVRYPAGTVFTVVSPDPGAIVVDDPTDGLQDANGDGESDGYATPCLSMAACAIFDDPTNPNAAALPNSGVAFHRVPSLWGIRHTAPYFHDNSAMTLRETAIHYRGFFGPTRDSMLAQAAFLESVGQLEIAAMLRDMAGALVITDQDATDIAAYMRLL